jgi:hypothetical protein
MSKPHGTKPQFKVESKGLHAIAMEFPQESENYDASIAAYLSDQLAQGWEFVQSINDGNGYRYFFKAV